MMTDACMLTAQHTVLATPIGDLTVVREGDLLTGLYFPHHWYKPDPVTFGPRKLLELEHAEVTRVRRVLAPTLWLWRRPFGVIVDQQEWLRWRSRKSGRESSRAGR